MAVPASLDAGCTNSSLTSGQRHDALIQLNVERDAAGEGELASFFENVAEVEVDQVQCDIFEQLLNRGCVVDIGIIDFIACALRAEPLDEFRAEVVAFAVFFVAAAADHVDEVRVYLEVAVAVFDQDERSRISSDHHTVPCP